MDKYIVITFESVNFAMQTESVLKSMNVKHQIIPTPREITLSCGLSIRTESENLELIKKLVGEGTIKIKKMYNYQGIGSSKTIEEIV